MRTSVLRRSISEVSHLVRFVGLHLHRDRGAQWRGLCVTFALAVGVLLAAPLAHAQTAAQFGGSQLTLGGGFSLVWGVAVDKSGNVFVADVGASAVKEIPAGCVTSGCVITLGSGFSVPNGVAVDGSGNVFVADFGNSAVKEILAAGGYTTVKTLGSGFNQPGGVAVDGSGNVFVADFGNSAVKEILAAGGYTTVNTLGSGFGHPGGVAVDGSGNVFVADEDHSAVKEILPAGGYTTVNTLGSGFSSPVGVAVDGSGNVFVADTYNNAVKEILAAGGYTTVNTLGSGFNTPFGVAVDGSGNVFGGSKGIDCPPIFGPPGFGLPGPPPPPCTPTPSSVVELSASTSTSFGTIAIGQTSATIPLTLTFTAGGTIGSPAVLTQGAAGLDFADAGTGTCTTNGTSHSYNVGDSCTVNVTFSPRFAGSRYGAAEIMDGSGNVVATEYLNGVGSGPQVGFLPGLQSTIASSGVSDPTGVAVDGNGNVYIVDWGNSVVYKETLSGGSYTQSTIGSGLQGPTGIAVDGNGNVYIAGYDSNLVYMETLSGGVYTQSTIGSGLSLPMGVAVDGSGNIYIADTFNNRVLEETLSGGVYTQSTVPTSGLNNPKGVAVDGSGNVYIADAGNNQIVKETFSAGIYTQSTVASGLNDPYDVAVDGDGNVYITDTRNNQVLMLPWTGSGYGTQSTIGTGFGWPQGVAVDGSGNVFVADSNNAQAVKLDYADAPSLSFASTNVGSTSTDSPKAVTVQNIGNAALSFPVPNSGTNPSIATNFTLDGSTTCPQISSSGTPGTLANGSSCVYAIDFTPQASGSISGSLVLTDSALNATYATQTINLSGTGINPIVAPTITWATPSSITYGTPLSGTQLNATASVSGTPVLGSFTYDPPLGTVLGYGNPVLSVTFTPNDPTHYSTVSTTVTLCVNLANATVTPNSATKVYGTADPAFSGTLSGFLAADHVTATYSRATGETVAGGPYPISATLRTSGSLGNYNITYNTAGFTITKASLTATANNASVAYGATLPGLTGTLTGAVLGDGITASYTTTATSSSTAGSYAITPVLTDPNGKLGNYNIALTNGKLTVGSDATTTTVQSSPPAVQSQSSVTLTATVAGPNSTPVGSVTFMDGATQLGIATLGNTGTATLTLSTLAVGSHNITAVYAGNVDFAGSRSSVVTETVQDFSFSVSGGTATVVTVMPGDKAIYTVQFAPQGASTFVNAVALTLTGLPTGATYTIAPSSIAAGSGTTTVTITVDTPKQQSSASSSSPKGGIGFPKPMLLAIFLPLFGTRKLRRVLRAQIKTSALMLVMLVLPMVTGMTACGNGSGFFSQAPQTYPMAMTGTSGALHHSATLNLTIQ